MEQILNSYSIFFAFNFSTAVLLLTLQNLSKKISIKLSIFFLLLSFSFSIFATYQITQDFLLSFTPFIIVVFSILLARFRLVHFSISGIYFYVSYLLLLISGIFWSIWFIATIPVSTVTRFLMFAGYPFVILMLPLGFMQFFEQFEVICRKNWRRPKDPIAAHPEHFFPKVSFHVPVYSEPPEIVKETLTHLANIDYPNYEVIVIDNNTKDENLWKPVEEYCKKLGNKFRFFHVEKLEGAKAGALNFALKHTDEKAELIGLIDCDYHAKPNFLTATVGYFKDQKMGFVQSPHDYRGWQHNLYKMMCYWEYKIFFHTTMVSLNERDAALTVGTMCVIRKKAIEEAGGWAKWCVTEDSEIAIRIHALGYTSVYLTKSLGQGLIPENFEGYKKQRFRWTAGPVQEFKKHFALLFPLPKRKDTALSFHQRVHHFNHGLDRFVIGISYFILPIGVSVILSMLYHHEIVPVPFALWISATVTLLSSMLLQWLIYKVVFNCTFWETIGATLASKALSHTIAMASFKTIFVENVAWQRTNKFNVKSSSLGAIASARVELFLGVGSLVFAAISFLIFPQPGLFLMFLIGVVYKTIDYLSAPFLALVADKQIQKQIS